MCRYCNIDSRLCETFYEPLTHEWYLDVETLERDEINGEYMHYKLYGIEYCPYCGRKLVNGNDSDVS